MAKAAVKTIEKIPSKSVVGTLTQAERDEIMQLNYRKQTLQTLFRSLAEETAEVNPRLYNKMMDDMIETQMRYDFWFRDKAAEHKWKSIDGMSWSVDFQTCEVFLTQG